MNGATKVQIIELLAKQWSRPPARATWLPTEVWVIIFAPNHGPEAVVATLMGAKMTRLAEDNAVVHGVRSSTLYVFDVMGLRTLAIPMLRTSCVA